jgi:Flp pilus assembly protein TadD
MPSTSATLADARRLCAEGRFHAATNLLLDAFRSDPEDAAVARELGATMRACGDFSCAIEYLQRAHNVEPQDARTVAELVLSYHALDQHEYASQVLIRSLARGLRSEELAVHLREAA